MKAFPKKVYRKIGRIGSACLLIAVLLAQSGVVMAQQTKVKKQAIPTAVIKAVEADYLSCKDRITWYVYNEEGDISYYVATAKGKNIDCEAVYDKDGNLMRAKTVMKNVKLSTDLVNRITADYPGWKITEDRVVIRDFDENKRYTEVMMKRAGESKSLYFDSNGQELSPNLVFGAFKNKVTKKDIPSTVANAVESDYLSCKDNITWYEFSEKNRADKYVATAKGKNITCESVYDSKGNLISSKTVATNLKLPSTILQAIYADYPDWRITEDQMVVRDFDESTKYYKVIISKDGAKQTLYYDAKGKKMKPRNI
ncbi:MAG: PepSY-like domain-containing protein [Balneolaceae bacterium]|nr:PepSY-like domain-containing protein [Balneolaceae bacterium]